MAPDATAWGTRLRGQKRLRAARNMPVSTPTCVQLSTRPSTRGLRRRSPAYSASGAATRRTRPTAASVPGTGAGCRISSHAPTARAGTVETARAPPNPAEPAPTFSATAASRSPPALRTKSTRPSCTRAPRHRSATPRNSPQPERAKYRTRSPTTPRSSHDRARLSICAASGVAATARTTPPTPTKRTARARARARSESVPATRARDAVACRPNSAPSAIRGATNHSPRKRVPPGHAELPDDQKRGREGDEPGENLRRELDGAAACRVVGLGRQAAAFRGVAGHGAMIPLRPRGHACAHRCPLLGPGNRHALVAPTPGPLAPMGLARDERCRPSPSSSREPPPRGSGRPRRHPRWSSGRPTSPPPPRPRRACTTTCSPRCAFSSASPASPSARRSRGGCRGAGS